MSYYQSHLERKHFDEWVIGSGVSDEITVRNVRSLINPEDIADVLNRNPKNRQQIKGVLATSGWAVTGVDPQTGKQTYVGAQFKPDIPIQRYKDGMPQFKKDGSPDYQKYFSASNCETAPLFLDTGEVDFWLKVKDDISRRIILGEGPKKAGAALTAGEVCISLPGVFNGQRKGRLKKSIERFCELGRVMVLGFDSDMFHNPNVCKALNQLGCLLRSYGVVVRVLILPRETKGIDDFIVAYGQEAFKQLVDSAVTFEEWRDEYVVNPVKEVKTATPDHPDAEENYQLKAQAALFSDQPWVSIDGKLYQWTSTHYELQSEAAIRRKIADWCRAAAKWSSEGWVHVYATATHVSNIYSWVVEAFSIDPATVNPPGLNCLNGVLRISWDGKVPRWDLTKHDPSVIYTYVGEFEFDPNTNPESCDRLLQCLEPPQREVLVKTLAASLDLLTIRKWKSRVRALLCKGDGNNGKDSIREAVDLLYGIGVTGCTFGDFEQYDEGRKFPLAKLAQARVNWSSENSDLQSLDRLQCLKKAISGEDLDFELKGAVERPMKPNCVFFFNINSIPNLQASMEAIKSRYAVLTFDKTFKVGADESKGELEADPRFRYDPEFIKKEVVPSLLNKMLAALPEVAMNGIDYSCTDGALEEIREEKHHLLQFAKEVGLGYQVGGSVSISELWDALQKWYVENGYGEIETDTKGRQKIKILDSGSRSDKPIKQSSDVGARFLEIFTKAKRGKDTTRRNGHPGRVYLHGIGFVGLANNTHDVVYESISSKIDYLSVEECRMLMSRLASRLDIPESPQPTQHQETVSDSRLNIGSTSDSTPPQQGSAENITASPSNSMNYSPISDVSSVVVNPAVSVGISGEGDVIAGNSTKNFDPTHHDFKIGDHVKVDCPGLKTHGKEGEIIRLKEREGLKLADVQILGQKRCCEAQLTWLHPLPPEPDQQKLF